MLKDAGFADVHVELETREDAFSDFEEYWAPIEKGPGSIPQGYLSLSETERRDVRQEVKTRLAPFVFGNELRMSVEMLIARGRA